MGQLKTLPFEAGRRGKPDELDANIAHLIGAYLLEKDPSARFDLRVAGSVKKGIPFVIVGGEVTETLLTNDLEENLTSLANDYFNQIHLLPSSRQNIILATDFTPQSAELAENGEKKKNGDSGTPSAVAYAGTPNHLPWENYIAIALRDLIDQIFQSHGTVPEDIAGYSGIDRIEGLLADGKINVTAKYQDDATLSHLSRITFAVQHESSLPITELRKKVNQLTTSFLNQLGEQYKAKFGSPEIIINGAGAWHEGGWQTDKGNREAKPYRYMFGQYGCAEDCPIGEDPSKPSGTGSLLARYIAVQIVSGQQPAAQFAKVLLDYAIGNAAVDLCIETTPSTVDQQRVQDWFKEQLGDDLSVHAASERFRLRDPAIYRQVVAASDLFHDPNLPWNTVDMPYTL